MHGVAMIFFFLIPSIPATLGNFFLPMMIGARDLAFPKLNLLSWYLLVIGGLFSLFAMLAGGVDTIAACKMLLVALFFMHVRHSTKLTRLAVLGGMLWLVILILLTMSDVVTRGWVGAPGR